MKKSILSVFVIAAAAIALVSCNKEVSKTEAPAEQKASTVSFVASQPDTKAAFGEQSGNTLPTLWTANDKQAATVLNYTSWAKTDIVPTSDGKSAYFNADIEDDETGAYDFVIVSPLSAFYAFTDALPLDDEGTTTCRVVAYEIPTTQTSGANSPDENAMVLLAATDKLSAWPSEQLDVQFHHMTAYLKLDLQNLDLDEGENVESVVITAADATIAGPYALDIDNGDLYRLSETSTVVVNTNGNNPVWVACSQIPSGTVLTITAKTDANYEYETEITAPADLYAGHVAEVTVDYDGIMGSEVLFSYEDWLGTYTINRDGTNTDTWEITVDTHGSTYVVDGIESLGVTAYGTYDPTTGNMVISVQDGLLDYTDEGEDISIGLYGVISYNGGYPYVTGSYDILTATWDNDAHSSASLTPGVVGLSIGDYTLSGFRFIGTTADGGYRYGDITAFTHLPNTLTRSSASAAPKPAGLGRELPAGMLSGKQLETNSLRIK